MKTNLETQATRPFARGLVAALLLTAAGCGMDGAGTDPSVGTTAGVTKGDADLEAQGPQNDALLHLRATAAFPGRSVVKFYEPQDGALVVSEVGHNGVDPAITPAMKKLDAVQLYEALTHAKAPDELVAAAARAATMAQLKRPAGAAGPEVAASAPAAVATTADVGSGVERTQSALKIIKTGVDQWFFDNFCAGGANDGINDWDWTAVWMHVTGSGNVGTRDDVNWVDSTVSVIGGGGSVHFKGDIRPWWSWSTWIDVMINDGFWNQMHRINNSTDFDVHAAVDQADGDVYNWCTKIATHQILVIGSN